MIPGLASTPPSVAFLLGFFVALALRRGRIEAIINGVFGRFLPDDSHTEGSNEQ